MDRRDILRWLSLSTGAAAGLGGMVAQSAGAAQAEPKRPDPPRGLPPLKITDISTILTAPDHIRLQVAIPGLATYGTAPERSEPAGAEVLGPTNPKYIWEPGPYLRTLPKLFEHLRSTLGDEVELLHDVHERITPSQAVALCKEL